MPYLPAQIHPDTCGRRMSMGKGTTSFEEWLADSDPKGHAELGTLHEAVDTEQNTGLWNVSRRGGRIIVIGPSGQPLILPTETAKAAFLKALAKRTGQNELDAGAWAQQRRAMTKE